VRAERERDELIKQVESERARLAEAFGQSPAFLAVLHGPEHVFEFVNDRYYDLVGRRVHDDQRRRDDRQRSRRSERRRKQLAQLPIPRLRDYSRTHLTDLPNWPYRRSRDSQAIDDHHSVHSHSTGNDTGGYRTHHTGHTSPLSTPLEPMTKAVGISSTGER
jgi:PAS domain-containing protein